MIDPRSLNAQGVRVRDALSILQRSVSDPQLTLGVQYLWAAINNLLLLLEDDAGVMRSYFGSAGVRLVEVNPYDGKQMPPAISNEPPPPFDMPSQAPLNPPAPPPDEGA